MSLNRLRESSLVNLDLPSRLVRHDTHLFVFLILHDTLPATAPPLPAPPDQGPTKRFFSTARTFPDKARIIHVSLRRLRSFEGPNLTVLFYSGARTEEEEGNIISKRFLV